MGVNGTDTLNSSLPNIGVNAAFKIAANGAMPPISFEQNISDDLAVDKNGQSDHGNHMWTKNLIYYIYLTYSNNRKNEESFYKFLVLLNSFLFVS